MYTLKDCQNQCIENYKKFLNKINPSQNHDSNSFASSIKSLDKTDVASCASILNVLVQKHASWSRFVEGKSDIKSINFDAIYNIYSSKFTFQPKTHLIKLIHEHVLSSLQHDVAPANTSTKNKLDTYTKDVDAHNFNNKKEALAETVVIKAQQKTLYPISKNTISVDHTDIIENNIAILDNIIPNYPAPIAANTDSTIKQLINNIRTDIYNKNTDNIYKLLSQDISGEVYKHYFTEPLKIKGEYCDDIVDPEGNTILLTAIAKACHTDDKAFAKDLALFIINDAKEKLSSENFIGFINYIHRYEWEKYYENTPLTLSIKSGLLDVAIKLVENGGDVNIGCPVNNSTEKGDMIFPLDLLHIITPYETNANNTEKLNRLLLQNNAKSTIDTNDLISWTKLYNLKCFKINKPIPDHPEYKQGTTISYNDINSILTKEEAQQNSFSEMVSYCNNWRNDKNDRYIVKVSNDALPIDNILRIIGYHHDETGLLAEIYDNTTESHASPYDNCFLAGNDNIFNI